MLDEKEMEKIILVKENNRGMTLLQHEDNHENTAGKRGSNGRVNVPSLPRETEENTERELVVDGWNPEEDK